MHEPIFQRLRSVRSRQQSLFAAHASAWGLLAGSILGVGLALAKLSGMAVSPTVFAALLFGFPVIGCLCGLIWRHDWTSAAVAIDRHYGFKDRALTALDFASRTNGGVLHELQMSDAVKHLQRVKAQEVVPLRTPRPFYFGCFTLTMAILLFALPGAAPQVEASLAPALPVITAQAERMAERVEELEDFAKEHQDPEVQKLVDELERLIEEMKQPGVDPREALAKLSEMESAIQSEQAKYNLAEMDAHLQATGESLSLAAATAAAGQALQSGEMEEAAEELEQLEAPELTRQERKAVAEELRNVATDASSSNLSKLSNALSTMAESLPMNKHARFLEGVKGLASEARGQSVRKKLGDLLRGSGQCLGECKSECQNAGGYGKGKGGSSWGLGESDNEAGEGTEKIGGQRQEQVSGIDSGSGEVDTETIKSSDGDKTVRRQYAEQVREYEKLSEAVLESEPIPLGHRETIRRYFKSIRPQAGDAETDGR